MSLSQDRPNLPDKHAQGNNMHLDISWLLTPESEQSPYQNLATQHLPHYIFLQVSVCYRDHLTVPLSWIIRLYHLGFLPLFRDSNMPQLDHYLLQHQNSVLLNSYCYHESIRDNWLYLNIRKRLFHPHHKHYQATNLLLMHQNYYNASYPNKIFQQRITHLSFYSTLLH